MRMLGVRAYAREDEITHNYAHAHRWAPRTLSALAGLNCWRMYQPCVVVIALLNTQYTPRPAGTLSAKYLCSPHTETGPAQMSVGVADLKARGP